MAMQSEDPARKSGKAVGIDLGTTNSLVAYVEGRGSQVKCLTVDEGSTMLPSAVAYVDDEITVGQAARRLAVENPRPGFEAYHFSATEVLSLYPIAQRLREHHPEFPPLPADWPAFKSPVLTGKMRDHFGWQPQWNFLDQYRAQHGEPNLVMN